MDEKSNKNIFYYVRYVKIKDSKYVKIYSINPFFTILFLYLIFSNVNGYFEENNGIKYLRLVADNDIKEEIRKYKELWIEIRDLTRSVTKNSDDFDEKYMKIKFNSHNELPLNKTIETSKMTIVARAALHENSKYYPQVLLD